MVHKVYRKKLDENGQPLMVNGDFVMELVESVELPDVPLEPNWHGLEQSLRYSDMFAKAFVQATEKGFNLFTTTLVNGKLGHASEGALQFAFSALGVEWTESEKTAINQILESHNFVTRI